MIFTLPIAPVISLGSRAFGQFWQKIFCRERKKGDVWFCELYLLDLQIRGWWGWASPGGERARATGMPRDPPVRPTRTIPRRRPRVIERATARGVGRHTPTWRQRKTKKMTTRAAQSLTEGCEAGVQIRLLHPVALRLGDDCEVSAGFLT
jgi:hypothetical protein